MKKLPILLCLFMASCSYFQEESTAPESTLVLFVINDESASISWDQKSKTIREQYLKKSLYKQIQSRTDIIYMTIHSKSNSASNQQLITWEEESAETDVEQQKLQLISRVLSNFEVSFSEKSEQQSSEIIELTGDIIRLSDQHDSVALCFVGDMQQESTYRNFCKTPLSDKRIAHEMAKEDALKLRQEYGFNKTAFQKVKNIEILLPADNLGMENLHHYYDALFQSLGYKNEIHWTVVR